MIVLELGGEFVRWEIATAATGALFEVNPFDEPDVASAKEKTAELLERWRKTHRLPEWKAVAEEDGLALMTEPRGQARLLRRGAERSFRPGAARGLPRHPGLSHADPATRGSA